MKIFGPKQAIVNGYFLILVIIGGVAAIVGSKVSKSLDAARDRAARLESEPRIVAMVKKKFPSMRVVLLDDLDQDAKEAFIKFGRGEPGKVCGRFEGSEKFGCGLLLTEKDEKEQKGALLLVYASDPVGGSERIEIVEDYRDSQQPRTNFFLQHQIKSVLENRGEGPQTITMPSDGIVRIAEGQNAMVFFFESGKIRKVWTSD